MSDKENQPPSEGCGEDTQRFFLSFAQTIVDNNIEQQKSMAKLEVKTEELSRKHIDLKSHVDQKFDGIDKKFDKITEVLSIIPDIKKKADENHADIKAFCDGCKKLLKPAGAIFILMFIMIVMGIDIKEAITIFKGAKSVI